MQEFIKILKVIVCIIWTCNFIYAQDTESGLVYSTPILSNPALSGSEAPAKLRMMYKNYYPGNNLNLHTIYCSYNAYSEQLHGGFGFYMIENTLGEILNDIRAGATYSYHLRASRDLYFNAGFMASVMHRGINAGKLVLPDQIDPVLGTVLPSGEVISSSTRTVFDASVGFVAAYLNYHVGFSVKHLATPNLSANGSGTASLPRRFTLHGSASFMIDGSDLEICPVFILNSQGSYTGFGIGGSVSYNDLSVNVLPYLDIYDGLSYIQCGIGLDMGRLLLAYNYCFNPMRNRSITALSLSNQLSLSISFNNVEKRDKVKAIKYPKM